MSDILEELLNKKQPNESQAQQKEQEDQQEKIEVSDNDSSIKEEPKEEIVETSKKSEQIEDIKNDEKSKVDIEEVQSLKKALEDSKKWGHQKNTAYVNSKRKLTSFLNKLLEDAVINEEEAQEGLKIFTASVDDEEVAEVDKQEVNVYQEMMDKLQKEFELFKKYNKKEDADDNYKAFFYFYPLLSQQEQEEILTYIQEEDPSVSLEKVMITGKEFNSVLFNGAKKHNNNVLKYVKSLQNENEKLKNDNLLLKKDVDNTYGKVHNRSISARASQEIVNSYKSSGDILADLLNRK